ncbi:sorting nexin-15, partial [Clarias magur]
MLPTLLGKNKLYGRFDEAVIEERRKAAEAMLLFATNIPALYNSPQLKEFFRGGEVRRPLDPCVSSSTSLPPPLIPLPKGGTDLGAEEETGREAPILTQELESTLVEKEFGEPEMAVEALSNMEISPVQERHEEKQETEVNFSTDQPITVLSPDPSVSLADQSEEFDSLFDCVLEEPLDDAQPHLSGDDLAIFDPCHKEDQGFGSPDLSELLSLNLTIQGGAVCGDKLEYVVQATSEMTAAQESEKEGDHSTAIMRYRTAVEILMKGVQGDVDPQQRDAVKRRVAECLEHAERLLSLQTP